MDRKAYLSQIDSVIRGGRYKDSWESLSQYEVPQWYRDAKFGIFIHWGVYSVPAFDSEWYPRNMYLQGSEAYDYHRKAYGSQKDFGYKDLIPLFRAENFDPQEWAQLFADAGARYVMPVAEHHDGFQMYKSELSRYNAWEMGPKRDVLGELSAALERYGIPLCASSHRAEHWFFMGCGREFDSDIQGPLEPGDFYWPSVHMPDFAGLFKEPKPSEEFLEDWLLRTCELIDRYRPRVVFFDWWIQHSAFKPYLKKFAAYYYNRAEEWGVGVAINYKHEAFMFGTAVPDIERGQFSEPKPYFWQSDTSVARNSWCYTVNNRYKTSAEILCDLLDIVSKNGTLLLNVGPRADGVIPPEDRAILTEIGGWLKKNGEAIYGSGVWKTSAEGPTEIHQGQFNDADSKTFTGEDIRYTKKGSCIYAAVLSWPEDGKVSLRALGETPDSDPNSFHGIIRHVSLLAFEEKPVWHRTKDALEIEVKSVCSDKPVVLKVTVD